MRNQYRDILINKMSWSFSKNCILYPLPDKDLVTIVVEGPDEKTCILKGDLYSFFMEYKKDSASSWSDYVNDLEAKGKNNWFRYCQLLVKLHELKIISFEQENNFSKDDFMCLELDGFEMIKTQENLEVFACEAGVDSYCDENNNFMLCMGGYYAPMGSC